MTIPFDQDMLEWPAPRAGGGSGVAAGMVIGPHDPMKLDEANWKCFANSRFDPDSKQWTLTKKPHVELVPKRDGNPAH